MIKIEDTLTSKVLNLDDSIPSKLQVRSGGSTFPAGYLGPKGVQGCIWSADMTSLVALIPAWKRVC